MDGRALLGRLVPAAVAVLVVLAGCSAPSTSDRRPGPATTGTTVQGNATRADGIQVTGGNLSFDPDRTFTRVQGVVDADVERPARVTLVDPDPRGNDSGDETGPPSVPPFWTAMGVDYHPADANASSRVLGGAGGSTSLLAGTVTLVTGTNDATTLRTVLAHEFVHYVQVASGQSRSVAEAVPVRTTDGSFVRRSVLEGVAVVATDAYLDRHLATNGTNHELYLSIRNRTSPGGLARYGNSQYVYGHRYVDDRIDDPGDAGRVYRNPPTTSEQVIHGYAPGEEPPRNLSVTATGAGEDLRYVGHDRVGEGFLRVALRNGLNGSAADRAAAGWGNDSLRIYRTDDGTNFVWTLRFDDRANASEFETLFRAYLDARGNRTNGTWTVGEYAFDLRTVGPDAESDAVVVLIGSERFVTATSVGGESGDVSVTLPGED